MPVIPSSRSFEGSDMSQDGSGKYILPTIPQVIINTKENKDGIYLFFMPSYKRDSLGNGVWYKQFTIRQNFGTSFKEKYFVPNLNEDPAEYFAKRYKMLFPEEAKIKEEEKSGSKFKVYPAYGNVTKRCVFNVLKCTDPNSGVHVLDLPVFNGASQIDDYHKKPGFDGRPVNLINDHTSCTPVFIKCKSGGGNPWSIQPDSGKATPLPEQLCSSEYLINLDNIFVEKPKEDIIEKLRSFFAPQIFDRCMEGYEGLRHSVSVGFNPTAEVAHTASPVAAPAPVVAPSVFAFNTSLNLPKAPTTAAAPATPDLPAVPTVETGHVANPMATGSPAPVNKQQALAFLQK
jgi:hypothetical protein